MLAATSKMQFATGNGHDARSEDTRARMVGAAIDVFGKVGYEASSTRLLVDRAGINLSAIPYHFGGKHGLYLAAAIIAHICAGPEDDRDCGSAIRE